MPHLRIGEDIVDRVDRAARHADSRARAGRASFNAGRFLERATPVAKSGVSSRSGASAVSQKRCHRLSPEATMLIVRRLIKAK
jgi:hypothetical protein